MQNITTEHVRFNFNRGDRGYIQPYKWIWREGVWKWNWRDFIFTVVTCISREWWSWIIRGIKLFKHSQFFSIRQNIHASSRLLDYIWSQPFCNLTSIAASSVIVDFVFPFCLLRPQCIIQESLYLYSNTIISSFYYKLFFFIFDHNSDTLSLTRKQEIPSLYR